MEHKELWKDIIGYEGLYQVSNLGRVKRLDSIVNTRIMHIEKRLHKGRILSFRQKDLYKTVGLSKDGKTKKFLVHRLVAQHFLPNPNNYPVVNHKDEDKTNNRVDNLEWCTQKHNMNWNNVIRRKVAPKLRKTEEEKKRNRQRYVQLNKEKIKEYQKNYFKEHYKPTGTTTKKKVIQLSRTNEYIATYSSIADASRTTNVNYAHISSVCNNKRKTAGGYKWIFAA